MGTEVETQALQDSEPALTKFGNKMKPRKFPCEFCDLVTKSPSDLQRHLLKHTGGKPFECPHCLLMFTRKYSLDVHQKRCKVLLGKTKVGDNNNDDAKEGSKRRRKARKKQHASENDAVKMLKGGEDEEAIPEGEMPFMVKMEPMAAFDELKKEVIQPNTEYIIETNFDDVETVTGAML